MNEVIWTKHPDDTVTMNNNFLSHELLKSIRDTEVRIWELIRVLQFISPNGDARAIIKLKLDALINTKMCLVYTFMDLNGVGPRNVEDTDVVQNPFHKIDWSLTHLSRMRK